MEAIKEKLFKYPRTPHLFWSENADPDDIFIEDVHQFDGKEVVVSEKCDGENSNFYRTHYHVRSLDGRDHISRHWVKNLWNNIRFDIPEGWRVCGENMFAWHTVLYRKLPTYFLVYGVYNEKNECLSWNDTLDICNMLGLTTVPVLYRGIYDEKKVKECFTGISQFDGVIENPHYDSDLLAEEETENGIFGEYFLPAQEGYVVRSACSFHYDDFAKNVAKFVAKLFGIKMRKNDNVHWMTKPVIKNELAK
jgi:hypothetical protein